MSSRTCAALLVSALLAASIAGALPSRIVIRAEGRDLVGCPVRIAVDAGEEPRTVVYQYLVPDGQVDVPAQVVPGDYDDAARELMLIVPGLAAGGVLTLERTDRAWERESFAWTEPAPGELLLSRETRPVLRYMGLPYDDSTPAAREVTKKVFHHLYAPDGSRLLTKGPGGLYPHHRGLFYGFQRVSYGDQSVNIWECPNASQRHEAVEAAVVGAVLGRQRVRLSWNGRDGRPFAIERRVLTAYATANGTLVEFASRLESLVDGLKLDGDPQHAGFHFRADNEVDQNKAQTYFIRPTGTGAPGTEQNWPAQRDHVNFPWLAMSYVIGGQRYTTAYLDRPENPKEARFSERTYGRFGSYFVAQLDRGQVLEVRYRLWAQAGEMTADEIERRAADFTAPPPAEVQP